jgi:dipeptidase E
MKLYLSSYKLGNDKDQLLGMSPKAKIALIPNALDFVGADLLKKQESTKKDVQELQAIGFEVEVIDLKDYFNKQDELSQKVKEIGAVFVRGGNTFVLRDAMILSGFDNILNEIKNDRNFLYSGYSAGICVLAPDMESLKFVDDEKNFPYSEIQQTNWKGLGIVDFIAMPHYKSDHPESKMIDDCIEYCKENNINYKPLRDGEVLSMEIGAKEEINKEILKRI